MKAILVMDIDEKYIGEIGTEIQFYNRKYNCKWILKPVPQKMRTDADDIEEDSYLQGWNDCLDEIIGGTE